MGLLADKQQRQTVFVVLHYAAGSFAFAWALYYFFSDALPYADMSRFGFNRTKATICLLFLVAAYMLLTSARKYGHTMQKLVGYSGMAVAFATLWLIFKGSSV